MRYYKKTQNTQNITNKGEQKYETPIIASPVWLSDLSKKSIYVLWKRCNLIIIMNCSLIFSNSCFIDIKIQKGKKHKILLKVYRLQIFHFAKQDVLYWLKHYLF